MAGGEPSSSLKLPLLPERSACTANGEGRGGGGSVSSAGGGGANSALRFREAAGLAGHLLALCLALGARRTLSVLLPAIAALLLWACVLEELVAQRSKSSTPHFAIRLLSNWSRSPHLPSGPWRPPSWRPTSQWAIRNLQLVIPVARHLVSPTWLLVCMCAGGDDELRLLAGMMIVCCPLVPLWEVGLCLLPELAYLVSVGKLHLACAWAPLLALAVSFLQHRGEEISDLFWMRERSLSSGWDEQAAAADRKLVRTYTRFKRALTSLPDYVPPTRKELQAWQKAFALDEELIGVYVCSVFAKVTHWGRLYISFARDGNNACHLSFSGVTVIRTPVSFTVEFTEVEDVKFSFAREPVAVLVLKEPIQMKGCEEPASVVALLLSERAAEALRAIFAGPKASDDGEDDEVADSDSDAETGTSRSTFAKSIQSNDDAPWHKLLEAHIPRLDLKPMVDQLLAPEWVGDDCIITEYLNVMGATDMVFSPMLDESDQLSTVHTTELNMTFPVPPQPMCPKTTKMTMNIRVVVTEVDGRRGAAIEYSSMSHEVPFGSYFIVQEKWEFLADAGDGGGVSLTKTCRLIFLKSCGFFKSRIESITVGEQARGAETLLQVLRKRATEAPSPQCADKPVCHATCTGRVWELQRRTTLFQTDWRAPFLPHDGDKRWRWVDDTYQKHHWLKVARSEAAAAETPPLEAGALWRPLGEWQVHCGPYGDSGECQTDAEGWMYAFDFYRSDMSWSWNGAGRHCRRRLWTRAYEDEDAGRAAARLLDPCSPKELGGCGEQREDNEPEEMPVVLRVASH